MSQENVMDGREIKLNKYHYCFPYISQHGIRDSALNKGWK